MHHPPRISSGLLAQLRSLALSPTTTTRPIFHANTFRSPLHTPRYTPTIRSFSSTPRTQNWLLPRRGNKSKTHKGRPQVNTGGSMRGTEVAYGLYGLRLRSLGGRVSSKHFRTAEEVIKRRLRGMDFRMYTRVTTNVAVYTKGNEQRMGKGKGSFDYWAARVAHGRVVLEIGGSAHEQIVKDALRLAANKLPGQWEFVKRGDPGVVGTTRLKDGMEKDELWRPKRETPLHPMHLLPDGTRAGDLAVKNAVIADEVTIAADKTIVDATTAAVSA